MQRIFPVNEVIKRRTRKGKDGCSYCGEKTETLEHTLFFCRHAELIWKAIPIRWDGLNSFKYYFWLWWNSLMEAKERIEGREHIALTINIL